MSEKLNLDILLSSVIHSHNYIRNDGVEASNSKYVSQIEHDKNYNSSPRNIRKLFIKSSGIDIVYYQPIAGKSDGSLSETISYSSNQKALIDKAYNYYERVLIGDQLSEQVNVSGTGFASFLNDLSITNLEELYFDWTLLLGNKDLFSKFYVYNSRLQNYEVSGLTLKKLNYYKNLTTQSPVTLLQAEQVDEHSSNGLLVELMQYITREMCRNRQGRLSSNYPRLKYVGFIGNSNIQLKADGGITKQSLYLYDCHAIYNKKFANVQELKINLCKGDRFSFSLFADTGVDLFTSGFRVDAAIYKYDKDVLYSYFKSLDYNKNTTREEELNQYFLKNGSTSLGLESKLEWIKLFRDGNLQVQKLLRRREESLDSVDNLETSSVSTSSLSVDTSKLDSTPKTEIERALTNILKQEGEQSVRITLSCLDMQYTRQNLLKEIEKFSPGGKLYYTSLLEAEELE